MALFTSRRERALWILAAVIQAAIYLTAGLALEISQILRKNNLLEISFIAALIIAGLAIVLISTRGQAFLSKIGLITGVLAVYWMVWVRIETLEERTHLFEYSLVGVLIFQALLERQRNNGKIWIPAVWAILSTALLGLLDEGIQVLVPGRYFDWVDVGFNALAGLMAVGLSAAIKLITDWRKRKPDSGFDAGI